MANLPISGLAASASNLASSDLLPVVQTTGVGPVKMTGLQVAGGLLGASTPIGSDVILSRAAAASLRLGASDAAAPVAQTFGVQSVSTGTLDAAGANFTVKGSAGTGTGAGGSIVFQVAPAGTTGTSQNAFSTALTISTTAITAQKNLLFSADNTYDIGASGATRPRNYYGAGTITSAAGIQSTGGNLTGNGLIINRGGTSYTAILDNGSGVMRFYNGTATSFTGIQLGGTNAKFPAIYTVSPDTTSSGIQFHTADASTGVFLQGFEQTAPSVAPANGYRIFAQDNGAGKTQLMVIFASGAAQQIAIEP